MEKTKDKNAVAACRSGYNVTFTTTLNEHFPKLGNGSGQKYCLQGDHLSLERAGTTWESREAKIPKDFHSAVIAIDGPLLPLGADPQIRRHVESVFIRAPRSTNHCRPGLSHHGVGLELRQASGDAGTQFGRLLAASVLRNGGTPAGLSQESWGHDGGDSWDMLWVWRNMRNALVQLKDSPVQVYKPFQAN